MNINLLLTKPQATVIHLVLLLIHAWPVFFFFFFLRSG